MVWSLEWCGAARSPLGGGTGVWTVLRVKEEERKKRLENVRLKILIFSQGRYKGGICRMAELWKEIGGCVGVAQCGLV